MGINRFARDEDGAFTILAIYLIVGCLAALGVAVDYSNAIREREAMQVAANSAALAAIIDLPDKNTAVQSGYAIAQANLAATRNPNAIQVSDIRVGNLDAGTGVFTADAQPYNCVDVEAERAVNRGNGLITYMSRLAGRSSYNIKVAAMACTSSAPCSSGGFFSDGRVYSGSNNDYLNGFCLYGEEGVKIGSDTYFEYGVKVEMPNTRDFEQSGNNRGVKDAVGEYTHQIADEYSAVNGVVNRMQSGLFTDLPGWIDKGPVYLEKIEEDTNLVEGTLYVVSDVADFGSNRKIKKIAVVAQKEVKVGSNNKLNKVFFATKDKLLMGSNNTFATNNFCSSGDYNSWLYSGDNIEFGSNNLLRGIYMVSREMIKLGSDVAGVEGVRAVARGDIDYGSADTLAGCSGGTGSSSGGGNYALVR